jgi:hypothetical protein
VASQTNGGITVPGNIRVFGDGTINGDLSVVGTVTQGNVAAGSYMQLTPTASPPASPAEGMLYADTDHKLYYYNGTDWKEVAFV